MLNSAYSVAATLQVTSLNPVGESNNLNLKFLFFSRVNAFRVAFSIDGDLLTYSCLI